MRELRLWRVWGEATAVLHRSRKWSWVDVLVVVGLMGILYGLVGLAREWEGPTRPAVQIDLSLASLPRYTFYSLCRGFLAYALSLAFTLSYGFWAAKDRVAERVLLPLLDILQSVPVLGFMPGLVLAFAALFPHRNLGLELAAVIMIFTGQAWNMTFSFHHSLRTVPADLREASSVYRFSWWQKFKWVELPFSMTGLVWNSMMSMAGGWFFLMISESFRLGRNDFRLPGVGAYMSVAVEQGRVDAMIAAVLAMTLMILALDQLFWRPVVVWAQKYRVEESGPREAMSSWFLDWLRRSHLVGRARAASERARMRPRAPVRIKPPKTFEARRGAAGTPWFSLALLLFLFALFSAGSWKLAHLLRDVTLAEWGGLGSSALRTLLRVLVSTALGTLWALPAGLAIGGSPRLSRALQPVVQVMASFPAPMLFPAIIAALQWAGVPLGWGSIVLMLMGTQWYILFNVIAGATAIPSDLKEAARSYRLNGWTRFRVLEFPAVFPYLVTGWITAAGGAWNASIVAEFVTFKGHTIRTEGLGSQISAAAAAAHFPMLAASIVVMSLVVVLFNRLVWRRCYALAEERFSLNK